MNKYLMLGFLTFAIAAGAIAMTTMTAQVASAQGQSGSAYGKSIISNGAQCQPVLGSATCQNPAGNSGNSGNWGGDASSAARDDSTFSTHNGLGDWRSNGCKVPDRGSGNLC